ncbi:MAG: hypothetical protein US62_C0013G0007 [Candidatus Woesebacteria bacterium GW2011_GWA1_37_8]|uniref:Uncharacterized protein n=1 Tax=Candidatus Woesebacteria bacterium GW2011_GWA1_37_8 TaxID=1618546 RepID=A0A0G0K8V2_9BACT|nr:MAG: hypothetical protein US62_C0013G0007 [Candidatus Woesebacteria bacterium GW2011_GWA1_37_8]
MLSKLIDNLKTKNEIEILRDEIALLSQSIYQGGEKNIENSLKNNIRIWVSETIRNETQNVNLRDYFNDIEKELDRIKSVSITLAYEPSELSVRRFYDFVQSIMPKKIVLELLYDPQIVGGVVISYGGRYKDYSFRKIFEDELEETRKDVLELLGKAKK